MLDLQTEILRDFSKESVLRLTQWIGADQVKFDEVMRLFLRGEYRLSQRTSWLISHCAEHHPRLTEPWLEAFVEQMERPVHNAVRRNVLRVLQFVEIPEPLRGRVMQTCFDTILRTGEPVANKAYALTVLGRLARQYPEISPELRLVIEDQLPRTTAAFRSRAGKVLREIP